jgi:acetylornithine/N-succinyldiaminopimelate aminotransferase
MISNRQLFLRHLAQTSPEPLSLEIDRAEGMYMYDVNGKKYLDLISGISVSNLGHRHPKVVKAIKDQTDKYLHTLVYGEFILSPQVELAKLLCDNLPKNLNSCYFVNSGTEATEGAIKLAKRYTGRPNIVAMKKSYHGGTNGSLSLMSDEYFTQPFRPLLPGIKHIEYNDFEDLEKIDLDCAAVIVETVRAEVGIETAKNDYLKALRKKCEEKGTLLILDEIQCGCGRTGTLFAFEQYNIVPDILLLAKGFGGGMPIGAFISSLDIMQTLTHDPVLGHITTFGGHPVSAAAALANLKILVEEKETLIDTVKIKEKIFHKYLLHNEIKEIKSSGLMMAVQLESFEKVKKTIKYCIENGLITDWFLFNSSALRIAPPLIINEEEIKHSCNIIIEALNYLS